jgi:hypothetical protein
MKRTISHNILMLARVALLLLFNFFLSCNNKPEKKLNYIFLLDKVDSTHRDRFKDFFNHPVNNENDKITQYQPSGYASINYIAYVTTNYGLSPIADACFLESQSDKSTRFKCASGFIDALEKNMDMDFKYRYILGHLEKIISKLDDTSADNIIVIESSMLENSYGYKQLNVENNIPGNYIFADNNIPDVYTCDTLGFQKAVNELNNSNSWIYKHLINNAKRKKSIMAHTTIYFSSARKVENHVGMECDVMGDFWLPLFNSMCFSKIQEKNFKNVSLFPEND